MLDLVVGALAALLVIAGIAIIAGPALPRFWRSAWTLARRGRPLRSEPPLPTGPPASADSALHPTTMRALTAAARAYSLLRAHGEDRLALELRSASRLVRSNETRGLLALAALIRTMHGVALGDGEAALRYRKVVGELRDAVKDRSEQLELLHFG